MELLSIWARKCSTENIIVGTYTHLIRLFSDYVLETRNEFMFSVNFHFGVIKIIEDNLTSKRWIFHAFMYEKRMILQDHRGAIRIFIYFFSPGGILRCFIPRSYERKGKVVLQRLFDITEFQITSESRHSNTIERARVSYLQFWIFLNSNRSTILHKKTVRVQRWNYTNWLGLSSNLDTQTIVQTHSYI